MVWGGGGGCKVDGGLGGEVTGWGVEEEDEGLGEGGELLGMDGRGVRVRKGLSGLESDLRGLEGVGGGFNGREEVGGWFRKG